MWSGRIEADERENRDGEDEEHEPEPERPWWRHGVYGFHPLRWGRIGVWGCEHGPQSQNEEQYPDRHADDAADRRDGGLRPAEECDPRDTDHGARSEVPECEGTGVGKGPLGTQKQDCK